MRLIENEFRAWLKSKPANAVVGENRNNCGCPIANFYREKSGGSDVSIYDGGDAHHIDRGYDKRRLPLWADHFVFIVDADSDPKITASRALEILK